jgi:hypothetical protein
MIAINIASPRKLLLMLMLKEVLRKKSGMECFITIVEEQKQLVGLLEKLAATSKK